MLKACNRQTATGRRDYAILLLLARLGLRAGEVVALRLDDIDWRAGEILVRGKGLLHDRMPLPVDVGEALTSYLRRDRPACKTRRVFVCMKAPRPGFAGPSTLTTIVRRALDRADLHPAFKGAHVLRHSLATTMLRSGATMDEIGEVLRHRAPQHNGNLRQGRLRWSALTGSPLADGRWTMKRLEQALNDYLTIRRALGSDSGKWKAVTELCRVSPSRRCLLHHQGIGASLGHPTREGSTFHVGLAFGYGPTLRHLAQCDGTSHRDSPRRASPSSLSTKASSHL